MRPVRIQFLSDLHFDVEPISKRISLQEEVDVVVVAGDICEGAEKGFAWLRSTFGDTTEILTVAGNHTFYRHCLPDEVSAAKVAASAYRIHFLENSSVELFDTTFVGSTLGTDYNLFGEGFHVNAMFEANSKMMDHKTITWSKSPWQRFRAMEARRLHSKAIAYLKSEIAPDVDRRFVVVTHHAPSMKSVPSTYQNDLLSAAYASELSYLIDELRPLLWLHGHIHSNSDYSISETRVVCNPHGYGSENPAFNPNMILEI